MNELAYDALRNRAAYIDLTGRGNIRATGDDRARLLHAMCTNHIEQLIPGTGCSAYFLTAQGRIIADANIFCKPDYLLIDTEPETRTVLHQHLDKYIIADDVTLSDFTEETAVISVEGPQAATVLEELGAPTAHLPYSIGEWGTCLVAHVSSTGLPGYSLMVPIEEKSDLLARLGSLHIHEARLAESETVRIENGHARFGVDFTTSNIPQETQRMEPVHFSKGCYLGQEIVERVRSRGRPNKVLVTLELSSETPPTRGAKIVAGENEVGEITSSAYSPALACSVALGFVRVNAHTSALTVEGVPASIRRAA